MTTRVLIVSNGWTIRMSGGDKHMLEVALRWRKKVGVSWILPSLGYDLNRDDYFDQFEDVNVFTTPWETEAQLRKPFLIILTYIWRIIQSLRIKIPHKPQIIVASSHFLFDVLPVLFLARRYKAKPYVYIHHVISAQRGKRGGLMSAFSRLNEKLSLTLIKKYFAGVIVVSPLIVKELTSRGFARDTILLSSNGIDLEYIDSVSRDEKEVHEAVFVGRLTVNKGIFDLPKIWEKVHKDYPEAKLAVIGDGPERKALESQIAELDLEKYITFLGFLSEEEKIKAMKNSKLFLFPSPEEGWGIVIAEAMACGLPVVAYDLPAYTSVFPKGIIKVTKGDWEMMAEETNALLSNSDQRLVLSLEGQGLVREYDVALVADKELRYLTTQGG